MAIMVTISGLPASMAMDLDSRIAFCKPVALRRRLRWVVEGHLVPAIHEVGDLRGVQILHHESVGTPRRAAAAA